MEGMVAIGLLTLISVVGWLLYGKARKRNGELTKENLMLREERSARIRQDKKFRDARGRDAAGDAKFLRDD